MGYSYQVALISPENSSTATLPDEETFTGRYCEVTQFNEIALICKTSQTTTVYVDFSTNGQTAIRTISFESPAGEGIPHRLARIARYVRVRVENESGSSSTVELQTIFGELPKSELTGKVTGAITDSSDVQLVRAVLAGANDNGQYNNVSLTPEGHMEVALHAPRLPFSSIHTERLVNVFQVDPVYGVNAALATASASLSGSATASDSNFIVSTGTTIYAQAQIQSRKRLRYRPGQGIVGRFTALFTTPVANSYQVIGFGHAEDGLFVGYKNTTFGILYSSRGKREVQTLTIDTASSTTENVTVTLAGVAYSVAVTNSANAFRTAYEISRGTFGTTWAAEAVGATVRFVASAVGEKTGAFSLSGTTAAGTFAETQAGVAATEVFIPQASFNGDPLDGTGGSGVTLDPTKYNVFEIGIQYLGAGACYIRMEVDGDGNNADFVTVHEIKFPNTLTTTSFGNPGFPFTMAVYSAGSTTNLTVKSGSFAGFIEGEIYNQGPRLSYVNALASVTAASYHAFFTVANARYYGGRTNQSVIKVLSISCAQDHTRPTTVYLLRNAVLVGNPNFAAYSSSSCALYDSSATTCTIPTNDSLIWSGTVGDTGELVFTFEDDITIQPGETLTVAAKSSNGNPSYVSASLNTREDQ